MNKFASSDMGNSSSKHHLEEEAAFVDVQSHYKDFF